MMPFNERLKKAIHYDPETGMLTWLRGTHRGHIVKVNDNQHGRRRLMFEGNRYTATHIIFYYMTGRWPVEVDHKNLDHQDDRWENLREATRVQNSQNRKGYSKSGFKGVYPTQYGRYQAMIRDGERTRPLGTFDTPDEAYIAFCAAAKQMHSAFFNGEHRDN